MQILALNLAGQPFRWLAAEEAVTYHAVAKVAWSVGEPVLLFRGGVKKDGSRSLIESPPIIAVAGSEAMSRVLREAIPLGDRNDLLFRRDHHLCAYCGDEFHRNELTRDHVLARDFIEKRVFGQDGQRGKTADHQGRHWQYQMPEVIGDLAHGRQLLKVFRHQAAHREPVQ